MESFNTEETPQSAGAEVKRYIEQEWTSEGMYCRSENTEIGMFEIVLPQISKDFGEFMQDLLACGIRDVEFRADTKETRLIVYTNESSIIPEYFRRTNPSIVWKLSLVAVCLLFLTLFYFITQTRDYSKDL